MADHARLSSLAFVGCAPLTFLNVINDTQLVGRQPLCQEANFRKVVMALLRGPPRSYENGIPSTVYSYQTLKNRQLRLS
jgi:hypothetical protein